MTSEKVCSIEGCGKKVKTRGWCAGHYGRWRRHGDPLGGRPNVPVGERFGRLLVTGSTTRLVDTGGRGIHLTMWVCKCDCGSESTVYPMNVKRGVTTSCGCYRRDYQTHEWHKKRGERVKGCELCGASE